MEEIKEKILQSLQTHVAIRLDYHLDFLILATYGTRYSKEDIALCVESLINDGKIGSCIITNNNNRAPFIFLTGSTIEISKEKDASMVKESNRDS